jgi:hypothetical protein
MPMNQYTCTRIREGDEGDPQVIGAPDPESAARYLVSEQESRWCEYPVASGDEIAIVEVKGHGQFEISGINRPQYVARRR